MTKTQLFREIPYSTANKTTLSEEIPSSYFLNQLRTCKSLTKLKNIHKEVIKNGASTHIYIASSLIKAYAKCGSLSDALQVFKTQEQPDLALWNSAILACTELGQSELALGLFSHMQHTDFGQSEKGLGLELGLSFKHTKACKPDIRTYSAVLKAIARTAKKETGQKINGKLVKKLALGKGMAIHRKVNEINGLEKDVELGNRLIDMYAKCGSMTEAKKVFDTMKNHETVSWNFLMLGYSENHEQDMVLHIYELMLNEGSCLPDSRTIVCVLMACSVLETGMAVHSQASTYGIHNDVYVDTAAINMYSKLGSFQSATRVFENMPTRDTVSYNAYLLACTEHGKMERTLELFGEFEPNARTYVPVLKALVKLAGSEEPQVVNGQLVKLQSLEKGMFLHSLCEKSGFCSNIYVACCFVDMYGKCGSLKDSLTVFNGIKNPDITTWTALIDGHAENGYEQEALELFVRMRVETCTADVLSFAAVFKACLSLTEKEVKVNGAVNKLGIKDHGVNSEDQEVNGEVNRLKCLERVMALHSDALKFGFTSDKFVTTPLTEIYLKCRSAKDALLVFNETKNRDKVMWNALILGLIENGEPELALEMFPRMKAEGLERICCEPDALTYGSVLKACLSLLDLEISKQIHYEVLRKGLEYDVAISTSMINIYSKCGELHKARHMFNSLTHRDNVTWNTLLTVYSHSGDYKQVFQLFHEMQEDGVRASSVTFVAVLNACSHAGLVEKGMWLLQAMNELYGVIPEVEHYSCMVDMLGRANQMEDAVNMLERLGLEESTVAWTAVLSACWRWENIPVGKLAFDKLEKLQGRNNSSTYMLMANVYRS